MYQIYKGILGENFENREGGLLVNLLMWSYRLRVVSVI